MSGSSEAILQYREQEASSCTHTQLLSQPVSGVIWPLLVGREGTQRMAA